MKDPNLALNNQHWLIYHKTQPTNQAQSAGAVEYDCIST